MRDIARVLCACVILTAAGCSDDSGTPTLCGPTNCQGCCQAGKCVANTNATCGLGGATCIACPSGQQCTGGVCKPDTTTCGPASCPTGCCSGTQCVPGNSVSLCGRGGGACVACPSGQACTNNACAASTKCDATTCPNGCCYNGVCMPGDNPAVCGKGGVQCVPCGVGQQCPAATKTCTSVQCNASTCPTGCCATNGSCVQGTSESACGKGGLACQVCQPNQACQSGSCQSVATCNASTCPGCCNNNVCQPGNAPNACGKGGVACTVCASSQECSNNVCACTPTSCPTGCCSGTQCQPGTTDAMCGKATICKACNTAGGEKCNQQSCTKTCAWPSCAGCCNTSNVCVGGNDPSACGINGMACLPCVGGDQCSGGTCNNPSQCGPSGTDKCTNGCCKNGSCQPGTSDLACGDSGDTCVYCAPHMTCSATYQECVIKPTAKLDVTLVSAEIDSAKDWDSGLEGDRAPDAYVELTVSTVTKKSNSVDNSYNPVFNSYLMTSTASDLMGTVRLKVIDSDIFGDDDIADCMLPCDSMNPTMCGFYDWELGSGSSIIYFPCSGNSDLKSISFKFSPAP